MSSHLRHLQTVLCSSACGRAHFHHGHLELEHRRGPVATHPRVLEVPAKRPATGCRQQWRSPPRRLFLSGAALQGPRQAVPSRASRTPLPTGRTCFVKSASSNCQASAGAILLARQSLRLNARLVSQCHRRIKVHSKHATKSHFQITNGTSPCTL